MTIFTKQLIDYADDYYSAFTIYNLPNVLIMKFFQYCKQKVFLEFCLYLSIFNEIHLVGKPSFLKEIMLYTFRKLQKCFSFISIEKRAKFRNFCNLCFLTLLYNTYNIENKWSTAETVIEIIGCINNFIFKKKPDLQQMFYYFNVNYNFRRLYNTSRLFYIIYCGLVNQIQNWTVLGLINFLL